jgi:hypothetical protein
MGWTVRGSNPGGGEIFRTCPDGSWSPPSLLYNGYRVFPGGKVRPERAADHSPPSSAVVIEEYSCTSTHPLGHNGPVKGLLYLLCNISFKEHLPEDDHNRRPKRVGGYADFNAIIYIFVHSHVGPVSHSENSPSCWDTCIHWTVILKWNWYKYGVMVLRQCEKCKINI